MSSFHHQCKCLRSRRQHDRGQASIAFVIVVGLVLLAMMGLAVDYTNLLFHRQSAQAAAEAACTAGAMDMLVKVSGGTPPSMGFTMGTSGQCSTGGGGPICSYAKFNGYNATAGGLTTSSVSNDTYWSFPGSVSGVTAPATSVAPYPYLKVTVAENLQTYFLGVVGGTYQQVSASCTCGLVNVLSAAPIIVLHPTSSGSLNSSGGSHIVIVGGPPRSIQVNSTSATSVTCSGGSGNPIDTSAAGPTGAGGDIGLTGGPSANFKCGANNVFNGGTNGHWSTPVLPIANPYAGVPSPTLPGPPAAAANPVPGAPTRATTTGTWVAYGTDSCPDKTQNYLTWSSKYGNVYGNCLEFNPGYYPSGIDLPSYTQYTAIFMPGVYYLNGNLHGGSSNTLRTAWIGTQPSTQGVMFYFLTGGPVFDGCSGCASSNVDPVPSYYLNCSGTGAPTGVPSSISGNILVAQCTANGTYYGSPSTDALSGAGSRGLLFFTDPGNVFTSTVFGASGTLLFSGSFYFHSTNYQDQPNFNGAGASTTVFLGRVVSDKLNLSGSGTIKMQLNPNPSLGILKVAMFQ